MKIIVLKIFVYKLNIIRLKNNITSASPLFFLKFFFFLNYLHSFLNSVVFFVTGKIVTGRNREGENDKNVQRRSYDERTTRERYRQSGSGSGKSFTTADWRYLVSASYAVKRQPHNRQIDVFLFMFCFFLSVIIFAFFSGDFVTTFHNRNRCTF